MRSGEPEARPTSRFARRAAAVTMVCAAAACTAPEPDAACGRDCLVETANVYLAAVAAHDPAAAPLARDVAFVENVTAMAPGEGIWASAAGAATDFRIHVPDPVERSVGVMTLIERRTADGVVPALLAVRLELDDGEIVEAEHLVADVPREADLDALEAPRPALTAAVPERERMPRAELAAIAASYYEALNRSDGSLAPLAADCERQENGMITAGPDLAPAPFDGVDVDGNAPPPVARDCAGQMSSRRFAYIDSIDDRRIVAIDPVRGLVMGLSHFRQSMQNGPHRMLAADGSQVMWDEQRDPYDLPAAHIFKITDGEIHEVEAIGIFVPYGSSTGSE